MAGLSAFPQYIPRPLQPSPGGLNTAWPSAIPQESPQPTYVQQPSAVPVDHMYTNGNESYARAAHLHPMGNAQRLRNPTGFAVPEAQLALVPLDYYYGPVSTLPIHAGGDLVHMDDRTYIKSQHATVQKHPAHRYVAPRAGATKWSQSYAADIYSQTPADGEFYDLDFRTVRNQYLQDSRSVNHLSDAMSSRFDVLDPRRARARAAFRRFDKLQAGFLDLDEFVELVRSMGHPMDYSRARELHPEWSHDEYDLMSENVFVDIYCRYV